MDPKRRLFNEKYEPASEGSDKLFETVYEPATESGQVECLGLTFENEDERRAYFLDKLRQGLEELHAKLGGVPFTTAADAVAAMQAIEHWPIGDEERLWDLAQHMEDAHRVQRDKNLLQLWKDEIGFPHGEIEDILALSDPPYYTACPNPFLNEFIERYGRPYDPERDTYRREPFAADVSEGRSGIFYDAHAYHTKVPHKAIMRYILHYTDPGDMVLDGFAGTGMTGVAAQLCGDRETVESLGYKVDNKGVIKQAETDEKGRKVWRPFSKLGARRAVLNDLSPAATFIAYNYNTPVDVDAFEREARRILDQVEDELGWMYRTLAVEDEALKRELAQQVRNCRTAEDVRQFIETKMGEVHWGIINYSVWSDVFMCPECANEIVFWDIAVDFVGNKIKEKFSCPYCGVMLTKRDMQHAWETSYDQFINKTIKQVKRIPVLINFSIGKKRYEKTPDEFDIALIEKINEIRIPDWFPTIRIPDGDKTGEPIRIGITHVHQFYTRRNLFLLANLRNHARNSKINSKQLLFLVDSYDPVHSTLMSRIIFKSKGKKPSLTGYQSGTLYISSLPVEKNILTGIKAQKLPIIIKTFDAVIGRNLVSTGDAENSWLENDSIDYIFTDPPFGGNLMYSELNFIWEAWLKIQTDNKPEAVTSKSQHKSLIDYQKLMTLCFQEYHRVLKPAHWMTVEFHNTQSSVWISIQEALQSAGFIIADVRTLDKKQGSFNQVTQPGAVKQDIIISCYKSTPRLEQRFILEAGTEEGVWDFVRTHLRQLPVFVTAPDNSAEMIAERQAYLLYDRMVAYHVQRGATVPYSAAEFYAELAQRFPERDEMYFLPDQAAEYDRKRMQVTKIEQLPLRIMDEASAIQWLRRELSQKPQTFQELHPKFTQESTGWLKHEQPLDLAELLKQNFLMYDGEGEVPSQIHSYLSSNYKELRNLAKDDPRLRAKAKDRWYVPDPNKAADLEKVRERALLREFERYKERSGKFKRNEKFRMEAIRAGFKKAWQERDYQTIINVAEKLPPDRLQEDPKLLMWYDQALTRLGEN